MIEREVLMFPETILEGVADLRAKTSLIIPTYRIKQLKPAENKKPRGVNRGLFEQNNPHADGERSKGVKNLPVTPRRSRSWRREASVRR